MTIKEYWNLIGRETFLAITWEPDFSQACSFRRMLMNHKNFHFTQIPDKTNDMIFLKSPKTMFLGHFWPFLPNGDFFQKNPGSHITIYGPLTACLVFKKTNEPILRQLTDGRTLFYRTPPAEAGGPTNMNSKCTAKKPLPTYISNQHCGSTITSSKVYSKVSFTQHTR